MREPRWLSADIVLAIHAQLLAEHGGSAGIRDRGMLESSLGRPPNRFAYGRATLPELAASLAFGHCRNHPFVDGNKRAVLACLDVFLQLQGRELVAPEVEAADTILALAEGSLTEKALAAWVKRRMKRLPATPRS